jgi:hypothetical protein
MEGCDDYDGDNTDSEFLSKAPIPRYGHRVNGVLETRSGRMGTYRSGQCRVDDRSVSIQAGNLGGLIECDGTI